MPDRMNALLQLHPLDILPLGVLFILAVAVMLLTVEVGYRIGRFMQTRKPDRAEASVGVLSGATLALLGFLLAFVTSSAVSSFAARRQAVVAEANAIGTAYLRAGYLPEPYGEESRKLLREYVDLRLASLDRDRIAESILRSEEIHSELWTGVETLAMNSSSPTLALYISSINEVIDLHTDRINVELVARVPWNLILTLLAMTLLAIVQVGLLMGYGEKRNMIALVAFVLVLSVVFLLIVDLSRGQTGLFRISYQSMLDLQQQFNPNL